LVELRVSGVGVGRVSLLWANFGSVVHSLYFALFLSRPQPEGFTAMLKMTMEEISLMRRLAEKEQTISGNKDHSGLKRPIAAGYVTETPATRGDTSVVSYAITDKGRAALAEIPSQK
jgi:hypothetical protein